MSKSVQWKESKAERRAERQKIGRLEDQRISPLTAARYSESLRDLREFTGLQTAELLQRGDIDDILSSYIEVLWEDGETKTKGNYVIAAVQFQRAALKGKLQRAWKLMTLWNKLEQPRRATPMDASMVIAFAGTFLQWQWPELACITVVGFLWAAANRGNVSPTKGLRRPSTKARSTCNFVSLWYEDCKTKPFAVRESGNQGRDGHSMPEVSLS